MNLGYLQHKSRAQFGVSGLDTYRTHPFTNPAGHDRCDRGHNTTNSYAMGLLRSAKCLETEVPQNQIEQDSLPFWGVYHCDPRWLAKTPWVEGIILAGSLEITIRRTVWPWESCCSYFQEGDNFNPYHYTCRILQILIYNHIHRWTTVGIPSRSILMCFSSAG